MKKTLLILLLLTLSRIQTVQAQRYLSEVFTSVSVTHNVTYGWNISGIPTDDDATGHTTPPGATVYNDSLRADVYQPDGDVLPFRPTVIMIHTGSFLPIFYNMQPTGAKNDSAIVEMCRQFARRGYTAISVDYRAGWNPQATGGAGQEIRTGTLLQAAGRGIQDIKACVRFFKANAATYHVDADKIILGGMGTGSYIALAYATVHSYSEIDITKFQANVSNPNYGFTAGVCYFDSTLWGDLDGYGGLPFFNNSNNTPGVNNDVSFVFSMGGALADSSWLSAGDVPMVGFHVPNDPLAPYGIGPVIVPTTGDFVIEAFGNQWVITQANLYQNNISFQNNTWTDPFTLRANQVNAGVDGLFPFVLPDPPGPSTGQAGPWEWVDSTTTYFICLNVLGFSTSKTDSIWYGLLSTNPDMSKAKGMAYIDSIMGYVNPRIFAALALSINENEINSAVKVYPNPSRDYFMISLNEKIKSVSSIELFDIAGRIVLRKEKQTTREIMIQTNQLDHGMYVLKIISDKGLITKKVMIE